VLAQTRRHSLIAHLVGIPHLVVAVNKMDLVGHDAAVFERIRSDYLDFARRVGIGDVRFVPMSALNGDMIVKADALPRRLDVIDAELCWLSEAPLDPRRRYLIRHTNEATNDTVGAGMIV